jgi:hypothetical protein
MLVVPELVQLLRYKGSVVPWSGSAVAGRAAPTASKALARRNQRDCVSARVSARGGCARTGECNCRDGVGDATRRRMDGGLVWVGDALAVVCSLHSSHAA